jgi:hypothetical protein
LQPSPIIPFCPLPSPPQAIENPLDRTHDVGANS